MNLASDVLTRSPRSVQVQQQRALAEALLSTLCPQKPSNDRGKWLPVEEIDVGWAVADQLRVVHTVRFVRRLRAAEKRLRIGRDRLPEFVEYAVALEETAELGLYLREPVYEQLPVDLALPRKQGVLVEYRFDRTEPKLRWAHVF